MAGPVYKMFYARMKEAWFQLSKEERDSLFGKIEEAMDKVGGKSMITCDSTWTSEKWWFWGVEEFPSIEAIQEHAKLLAELNWFRYCDSETLLGTAMQADSV
jgi:uncharacterized protein DUF6616